MVVVAEAGAGASVTAVGGVDGFAGSICVGTRRHQRSVSVHPSKCLIANESTKAGRSGSERFSPDGGEEALAVLPSTAQRLFCLKTSHSHSSTRRAVLFEALN